MFFSLTTAAFLRACRLRSLLLVELRRIGGYAHHAGTYTFSETVADSSHPQLTATQNYSVAIGTSECR